MHGKTTIKKKCRYLSIVQINPFKRRPSHSANDSQSFQSSVKIFSRSTLVRGLQNFFLIGSPKPALGGHDDLEPHSIQNGYILQSTTPLITAWIHLKSCNLTRSKMDAYYTLKRESPIFMEKDPTCYYRLVRAAARQKKNQ
jgi:hypothetical protein